MTGEVPVPDVAMRGWLRVPAFTAASLTLGVLGHAWASATPSATAAPAVAPDLSGYATDSEASTARTLGVIGLSVGLVALVLAGIALVRTRPAAAPPAPQATATPPAPQENPTTHT
jgi:hypothetical protein